MYDVTMIRRRAVMTRALLSAAAKLGLSREQLAAATGLGLSEITALNRDALRLDPEDPRWEACVLLVRIHGALMVLMAADPSAVKGWMRAYSADLHAVPAVHIGTPGGLETVVQYLEMKTGGRYDTGAAEGSALRP